MTGTWLGAPVWIWVVVGVVILVWNIRFVIKNKGSKGD